MNETQPRLTLAELEQLPEYARLTPKQKLFIATYCEGGLVDGKYDAVAATLAAYACKSVEVARIMSYSMMQNRRIIEVLNRHFGTTPTEAFLVQLDRAINNKNLSLAQLEALRIKCQVMGLSHRLPGRQAPISPLIDEAREAERAARRAKRKKPERAPAPEKPSEYGF